MKWSEMSERERDVLIADKVFDYVYLADEDFCVDGWGEPVPLGSYSTNIADAWQVLKRFSNWQITKFDDSDAGFCGGKYRVFIQANKNCVFANTECEAICIIALKACGVEIEQ